MLTCTQKVCAIFLQSIGHAKKAAPLSVLRDVLLILFSILAPMFLGVTGIFWAAPVADVIAMLITGIIMVRLWKELGEEGNRQPELPEPALQPSHPGVIITISREHGSAGKRIGQLVAQKMGIPCYYKEMVAIAYYKNISGRAWGDPHGYEICVNSSIGIEETANLICDYLKHI